MCRYLNRTEKGSAKGIRGNFIRFQCAFYGSSAKWKMESRTEKVFLQFLLFRHHSSIIHGAAEAASDAMERISRKNEKF